MSESVQVALIVATGSFAGIAFVAWIQGKQRSSDKREDWRRQDVVASRVLAAANTAKGAADLLVQSNATIAGEAKGAAQANKKQLDGLGEGLKEVHELVNSNLTEQIQENHDSAVLWLAQINENIAEREARGDTPSPQSLVAKKLAEDKVAALEAKLSDRQHAQNNVDAMKADAPTAAPA